MHKIILTTLVAVMMLFPAVAVADAGPQGTAYMRVGKFPEIEIDLKNSSFNLTFLEAVIHESKLSYVARFPAQQWEVQLRNSSTLVYSSKIAFVPAFSRDDGPPSLAGNGTHPDSSASWVRNATGPPFATKIDAICTITFSKENITIIAPNGTVVKSTGIGVEIELYSDQITGSGSLNIIQVLGANVRNHSEFYHSFFGDMKDISREKTEGVSMENDNISAYYIWNSSYTLNGREMNMANYTSSNDGVTVVEFTYNFTNGIRSLYQDPYFSVPDFNVFLNKFIDTGIQTARDFIVAHAELFSAGILSGMVFLGVPYGVYRRKRL